MTVLVIGGTGTIGLGVTEQLVAAGYDVTLYNRGRTGATVPAGVAVVRGDRTDHDAFEARVADLDVDAVVDMDVSYGSLADVESSLRAFEGRIDHYVFCSTVTVYRQPAGSLPMTEEAPRKPPGKSYGGRKVACEDRLLESYAREGFPVTILRPGHTYGEGGTTGGLSYPLGFWKPYFVDRLRKGKPIVVHGDGTARWGFCHRDEVASAFVAAVGDDGTVGETYHVPNPGSLTWNAYVRTVADAVGAPEPTLVHVPSRLLRDVLPDERNQLAELGWDHSWVFETSKAEAELGFESTVPLREGVARTVDWLDERGRIGDSDREPLDDRIVDAWRSAGAEFVSAFERHES